jgi:hypothetical protein
MRHQQQLIYSVLALALIAPTAVHATAAPLRLDWNLRLRHEGVDDQGYARSATADTARLRAAIRLAPAADWTALVEAEAIVSAGDGYNSGANGRTDLPAITDPAGLELNQAWLAWKHGKLGATLGRQRIVWDSQRWIGNVGWRQNEQSFDALSLEGRPSAAVTLRYAWLDRVHRIAGDEALDPLARERSLDSHLFNASYKRGKQQWVGYGYFHEDRDVRLASTSTFGLRWTGEEQHGFGWTAEWARQQDYADNPLGFSHSYWLLEPSLLSHGITWKLGWEHLGGSGTHALQTPLATLHAFNGWADKFTTTPGAGLEDLYLLASAKAGKFTWAVVGHDYRADAGDQRYGHEWNLSLARPLSKRWIGLLKLADYRADGFGRDTRKLWLQFEYAGSEPH